MAKSSIPTFVITPGFRSVSYEIPTTGSHTGVLLSQVAVEHLGLRGNDELIVTQEGGLVQDRRVERVLVQGVFPYPSDGRDRQLEFAIVATGLLVVEFDACWGKFRYLSPGDEEPLRVALGPGLSEEPEISIRNYNSILGAQSPPRKSLL